jgi:hypothetical protein
MPFTLAHPAAILPLHARSKSRLPLSALVIGSMSPDFAYFVPHELAATSHSFLGIFTFCWPAGFVAWLIFEYLLKQPTLALSPYELQYVSKPPPQFGALLFLSVSAALVAGAATHIIWDAFTHASSPLVAGYPQLRAVLFKIGGSPVRVYNFLHHASTAIGLIVVVSWVLVVWRRIRDVEPGDVANARLRAVPRTWSIGAIGIVVIAAVSGALIDYFRHPGGPIERQLFFLSIGAMTGCVVSWCAIAAVVRVLVRHGASPSGERI